MKPFRIVVAGCGGMAGAWVSYALGREDCEIVGLLDIRLEQAELMAQRFGLECGLFTDIRQAVKQTGANLVFDVTPPDHHFRLASEALSLGCHVFGEKPLAASLEEAAQLVEMAAAAGRTHAVMQNRRYNPGIRAFRELLQSGDVGEPGLIAADFFIGAHFGGFRDAMESPLIVDMAIHTFDQARFLTGQDAVSVYCHEFNPRGSWYQGNAAAVCIFEMADGSVFTYRGMWCAEGARTSWESAWRVAGTKGTALWDGEGVPYGEVAIQDKGELFLNECQRIEAKLNWQGKEGHDGCLDEMFQALAEGRKAETDSTDNIKSVAMVYGALQSAREQRKVDLTALLP